MKVVLIFYKAIDIFEMFLHINFSLKLFFAYLVMTEISFLWFAGQKPHNIVTISTSASQYNLLIYGVNTAKQDAQIIPPWLIWEFKLSISIIEDLLLHVHIYLMNSHINFNLVTNLYVQFIKKIKGIRIKLSERLLVSSWC